MPRPTSWSSFKRRPFDVPFFPKASQFALELSRELVDEPLVAEENIPQPVQDTLFEFGRPDPAISIAGAFSHDVLNSSSDLLLIVCRLRSSRI
jgi:hypothetical protein